MRNRRQATAESEIRDYRVQNPAWDGGDREEGSADVQKKHVQTEDGFIMMGRIMKDAGKGIWRQVRQKDRRGLNGSEDEKETGVAVHDPEKGGLAEESSEG
jgi:hypothetical protein